MTSTFTFIGKGQDPKCVDFYGHHNGRVRITNLPTCGGMEIPAGTTIMGMHITEDGLGNWIEYEVTGGVEGPRQILPWPEPNA